MSKADLSIIDEVESAIRMGSPEKGLETARRVTDLFLSSAGSFEKLAMIANGSVLIVYAICCLGVLMLRRRGVQESDVPFTSSITRFAPFAAVAVIVWLLTGLSADEWKSVGLLIVLLVAAYAISSPSRRAARVEEAA